MAKVLIVDDDVSLTVLLQNTITKAGFEVYVAHDGIEALEKFALIMPDVVLLDINMPFLDGLKVGELLRTYLPEAEYAMIYLTVKQDIENKRQAYLKLNAFDYLEKPFATLREVVFKIQEGIKKLKIFRKLSRKGVSFIDLREMPLDSLISVLFQRNWRGIIKIKCEKSDFEEWIHFDPTGVTRLHFNEKASVAELLRLIERHKDCWAKIEGEAVERGIHRGRLSLLLEAFRYKLKKDIESVCIYNAKASQLEALCPNSHELDMGILEKAGDALSTFRNSVEQVELRPTISLMKGEPRSFTAFPLTRDHCLLMSVKAAEEDVYDLLKEAQLLLKEKIQNFRQLLT